MANFTITSASNATDFAGKAGADAYLVNGGTLTLDCDTRVGPNQGQPFGNISISATLGGKVRLDGSKVRLVPFTGGSGAVPAAGTTLTQGAASVELLCVMSTRTGGVVHAGQMPTSGWLKVRGTGLGAGPLTGIGAVASGPDETGWIVLAGVDSRTLTVPRLGTLEVAGEWFTVGTTSGVRGQTMQLPHFPSENATYYPGVDIDGVFWPNAGKEYAGLGTDSRSRFCHISATGVLTLGGPSNGHLPAVGLTVRIPNIILQTAATNRAHNAEPSDVMGVRYEPAFGNGGNLSHSLSTGAWFWNVNQARTLLATDLHACDQVNITRAVTSISIDRMHVGLSTRATSLALIPLTIQSCTSGGVIGTVSAVRANCTLTSGYGVLLSSLSGTWAIDSIDSRLASNATAVAGSLFINGCESVTVRNLTTTGKRLLVSGGRDITVESHTYADNVTGTTGTTGGSHALEVLSTENMRYLGAACWADNTHPRNGLVYSANTRGLRVRGIGTAEAPFNGGTVNPTAQVWSDGGNNVDTRVERCWVTDTRVQSPNSSSRDALVQNVYIGDASRTFTPMQSSSTFRGNRCNGSSVPTLYSGTIGTTMWDAFTSDSTTRLALVFAEPTLGDGGFDVLAGNPRFTGQGGLVMQAGDSAVWTSKYSVLGWAGLTSFGVQGQNTGLHSYEYALDRGEGWSAYKTLNNANLLAEPALSPAGFRVRVKVTCTASNFANHLTGVWVNGLTTLALQNAALYPLDAVPQDTVVITGLEFGSHVTIDAERSLFSGNAVGGGVTASFDHDASRAGLTVAVTKAGFAPIHLTLANGSHTLSLAQQVASAPSTGGEVTGANGDIAAAVQALLLDDFAALDARISNQMHDAYDENRQWYVLTKWGQHFVGLTYHNPYEMDLPEEISIAEMSGVMPDLNFNTWDFTNDIFRASLAPRLNFLARFTVAELAAIRASADATVADIMERIDASKHVNTQDQLTVDSVQWLVTQGLLTDTRATEILA